MESRLKTVGSVLLLFVVLFAMIALEALAFKWMGA
jgi:hypothetical protein